MFPNDDTQEITDVKKLDIHFDTLLKISDVEFLSNVCASSETFKSSKFILSINPDIILYPSSIYVFRDESSVDPSSISEAIPHIRSPTIIANTTIKTTIALVFLVRFVLLYSLRIIGSTKRDIINAIKNGM